MKRILPFLLAVLLLTSCEFQEITFTGVENVNLVNFDKNGVDAEIRAIIKNPNGIGFTIYKSDMDVTLSGIDVGKAKLTNNVKIKANSEEAYTFKVKSDFSKMSFMDLPRVLAIAMSNSVKVGIKGDLKVGKLFIKKSIKVDVNENVPIGTGK